MSPTGRDFVRAGLNFSLPLITIAAASAFGWMLAYPRGPIVVAGWIGGVAGTDPVKVMLILVIPAIIIFMPVVNALTDSADIKPVHMGVVLIVTLAFGLITPPHGLALLMASKFVGTSFNSALKASLPIYIIFFATIAFTIIFPAAVMWLPKTVLPESVGCFKAPSGTRAISAPDRRLPAPLQAQYQPSHPKEPAAPRTGAGLPRRGFPSSGVQPRFPTTGVC
jgi:hypothetical protein